MTPEEEQKVEMKKERAKQKLSDLEKELRPLDSGQLHTFKSELNFACFVAQKQDEEWGKNEQARIRKMGEEITSSEFSKESPHIRPPGDDEKDTAVLQGPYL